jgi:oxaloacetate decarboxylase gamma subunit
MNESALMMEALRLMGIGMGIVFCFLLLLVGILRVMSWAALKLAPPEPHALASPSSTPTLTTPEADDLIAVIAAAIARYRTRG